MVQRSYYRAIWISDIHLGTRACKASALLDFLRHHIAETLYLVGDIVDGWNWGPSWHWSVEQQELVNEIVRWRRSANVVFLPGNHDESKLSLVERLFGSLPSTSSLIHTTAAGAKMLVIHGHQFDGSLNPNRLLPMIGHNAYARAQRIHDWYNRRSPESAGDEGRSICDYLRYPARKAIEFFTDFRDRAVLAAARDHKADGVICGHIHRADHRQIGSILYVNDGDWVLNRTAVVEDHDGSLQVIRWNGAHENLSVSQPASHEVTL